MKVMPLVAPYELNMHLRFNSTTPNTDNLENLLGLTRAKTYEVLSQNYYEYRIF